MPRLPVALLSGLLLVISGCAVSTVSNPSKVRLTDRELEETTGNPRPEDESPSQDQSLRAVKESIVNTENTRIQGPLQPAGPSLPAQGATPLFPR
jgi:hypothetical protein